MKKHRKIAIINSLEQRTYFYTIIFESSSLTNYESCFKTILKEPTLIQCSFNKKFNSETTEISGSRSIDKIKLALIRQIYGLLFLHIYYTYTRGLRPLSRYTAPTTVWSAKQLYNSFYFIVSFVNEISSL